MKGLAYCNYLFVHAAGFIDFIVDPSFQVMGDMLEKILSPLQQSSSPRPAITEEVNEKRDQFTSTTSLSSRPSTPKSPGKSFGA